MTDDKLETYVYAADPVDWPPPETIGPWEPYEVPWHQSTPSPGPLMRMRATISVTGRPDAYCYREMTPQESADHSAGRPQSK